MILALYRAGSAAPKPAIRNHPRRLALSQQGAHMADNSHDKDSHQESRRRDIGSGQAKIGVWRSWLAYASGGRVVASSSLVTPTHDIAVEKNSHRA